MDDHERTEQMPVDFDPATITPSDSPLTLADVMTSPSYTDLFTPKVAEGGPAIDFALPRLGSDEIVRLSEISRHQPVALIFGSYT